VAPKVGGYLVEDLGAVEASEAAPLLEATTGFLRGLIEVLAGGNPYLFYAFLGRRVDDVQRTVLGHVFRRSPSS
jgi:hypothetical protein